MRPMARLYAKKAASRSAAVKMTQGGLYFLAESANLLLQKREEGLKIDSESERLKTCGGGLRSPSYRAMENHIQRKGMNKMNQTQTRSPRKRLLSLILAVILMIGLLPISAFATGDGYELSAGSRFFIVNESDPTGTDLGNFVQLIGQEFAAKGKPSSSVLPIVYGQEKDAEKGDIVVKLDSSLGEQSYKVSVGQKIVVTGGDAAGAFYGLTNLLQMFEKNSLQDVTNTPLVAERSAYIDCGRVYFSPEMLKALIKTLAWNRMNTLYLDFSNNNATRFFMNEMKVTVDGTTYDITKAKPSDGKYLTQADMVDIIKVAKQYGVQIIPTFNSPGHIGGLYSLNNSFFDKAIATDYDNSCGKVTLLIENKNAYDFGQAVVKLYVDFFAGQGCKSFNIAADEATLGNVKYDSTNPAFVNYVNDLNTYIKGKGMTTRMFCDGVKSTDKVDKDIVILYWQAQSPNAQSFADAGYQVVNMSANAGLYYAYVGNRSSWWVWNQDVTQIYNSWNPSIVCRDCDNSSTYTVKDTVTSDKLLGAVFAMWTDYAHVDGCSGNYLIEKDTNSVVEKIQVVGDRCWNNKSSETYANWKAGLTTAPGGINVSTYAIDGTVLPAASGITAASQAEIPVADNNTGVSVVVKGEKGQTGSLTVDKLETSPNAEAITAAGAEKSVSYNVTPAVDGKDYTGEGTVTLPVPEGWATEASRIRAYIIDNGAVKLISGTLSGGKYTFQVPHFSEMGLVQLAKGAGSTENVTVAVGRTSKAYDLTGDNLPNDDTYSLGDIASYTVTTAAGSWKVEGKANEIVSGGKYAIGDGSQYLTLNDGTLGTADESSNATVWTITKSSSNSYTIKSDSYYLRHSSNRLSVSTSSSSSTWSWSANDGFYFTDYYGRYYYLTYSNGWTVSRYASTKGQPYTATEVPGGKTVTFKGVAVGNTTAVIGDTQYNITVVNEDLDNAATLPIQLWITNSSIEVTGVTTKGSEQFNDYNNGGYAYYVTAKAEAAFGEKGVALSQLVPDAVKDKSETSRDDRDATYALWKGTVLNTTTGLQKVWWTDMTKADGRVDYQYVRYYSGSWAVSSDRENWTIVTGEGSTGGASSCKEQVIAYYMQRTDVTQEVITDVVDWGNPTDKWATERPTQYGVLDFAVKYPDGTRVPDSFPEMGKTVYFHCDESDKTGVVFQDGNSNYYRRIGLINGIDTTGYEIYMITVTPTSDTPTEQLTGKNTALTTSTKIEYKGTEKVAWVDDEGNLPSQFKPNDAKFSSISGNYQYTVGGNPNIEGLEIYQRQGMLVTYYIRPVATMDSLHVHYINKNTGNEFYTYPINVKVEFGKEDKAVFNSQIGLDTPWKGPLKNGTVVNDMNVKQTVSADLSTMPAIGAEYRYSTYTCVEVVRSDNGKDVYLYYTFANSKTFVVDFGLPLEIAPKDMNTELNGKVNKVEVANADHLTYGTVSVKNTPADGYKVVYKLNKTIDGYETINLTYSGVNTETFKEGSVTWTAYIIPASNVYYEDSLASFSDGKGVAKEAKWSTVGNNDQTTTEDGGSNVYQALEELGSATHNVYGYDGQYSNSSKLSMGTAHKVTVTSAMLANWEKNDTTSAWPTASFTFTGTGFDVISLTDNTSGAILVKVTGAGADNSTYSKNYLVNNYYGYKPVTNDDGSISWVVSDSKEPNALYQIPVMKVDVPYGAYNVTIQVFYNQIFDKTGGKQYNFWLDAIRVYNPMGENGNSYYTQDNEGYPQYIELHDEVVKKTATPNGNALFIDGKEDATIAEYTSYGPNNEVYLMDGQAITFKLTGDTGKIASIQIGAKAPKGKANLNVNKTDIVQGGLSTATEMYYDITTQVRNGNYQVTITNATGNILSLTNLKITYSEKGSVSLAALNTQEQENAVSLVRALFTAPVATFSPETFEADWGRAVRAGKRATLTVKTSADVESITVDGQSITGYTTRTQRTGWGWWSPKVTYHVFTYTITAPAQTTDYAVCAVNAEGTASEAVTATLTVKPTTWWNWWF